MIDLVKKLNLRCVENYNADEEKKNYLERTGYYKVGEISITELCGDDWSIIENEDELVEVVTKELRKTIAEHRKRNDNREMRFSVEADWSCCGEDKFAIYVKGY